jgi:hypothetical protein
MRTPTALERGVPERHNPASPAGSVESVLQSAGALLQPPLKLPESTPIVPWPDP